MGEYSTKAYLERLPEAEADKAVSGLITRPQTLPRNDHLRQKRNAEAVLIEQEHEKALREGGMKPIRSKR